MLLCIENTGTVNPISVDAQAILKLIRCIGSDNLGICLDTGHFHRDRAIAGEKSQQEFIYDAGHYLKALHIADNDGTSDQHKLPFGNPFGKNGVNFTEVVASLYDIGYDELFNFEIPGESAGIPIELAKAKLPYIKSLYLYLMSQAREKSMEKKEII